MKRLLILTPLVTFLVLASLQFHSQAKQDATLASPARQETGRGRGDAERNFFEGAERRLAILSQARLEKIQARHEAAIMKVPGVLSIGIGLDKESRQLIFVVTVAKDKPEPEIPQQIEGVPVRVEQGDEISPMNGGSCQPCHSDLHSTPIECGNSFSEGYSPEVNGNAHCGACTMGFKAYKQDTGNAEWLTNAHCQRDRNDCDGQKATCADANCGFDSFNFHPAMLDRSVLGLCLTIPVDSHNVGFTRNIILEDSTGRNLDAATVGTGDDTVSRSVRDIGVPDTNPATVIVGDSVQKSGRTTGHTKGNVTQVNLSRTVEYNCRGFITFTGVIEATVRGSDCTHPPCFMGQEGDSGSGVFTTDATPKVAGLLFAKSGDSLRGFFFPIQRILNAFNMTLDPHATGSCSAANDHQKPTLGIPASVTKNADSGFCSTVVTFMVNAVDNCTTNVTPSCTPPSGQTFLLGTTTVTCSATDLAGNTSTASFPVTVNDTQAPQFTNCPSGELTQNTTPNQCTAVVSFATAATDNCNFITPVCTPASGSTFQKGTTTVTCTATDAAGNSASPCSFTVKVSDAQLPTISQTNITQSTATNQCSAVVSFTPTVADNCPGVGAPSCTPASGSTFQKGTTTVTCSVTDAATNVGTTSFTVTVTDTQAPTISCPASIIKGTDANSCAAVVSFTPSVNDNCSNVGAPACIPASGSVFPKGTTTVTCTVSDAASNASNSCSFVVTVNDTQSPSITCPQSLTVPAAPGLCSAVVSYASPAVSDNCSGVGAPTCTPPSGSTFLKGVTTISCVVRDAANNQSSCALTITVIDTQLPTIACSANLIAATVNPGDASVAVSFGTQFADNCSGVTVSCAPPSGAQFPRGTTTITCTATDASNNKTSCSFTVRVFDYVVVDGGRILRFLSTTGDYDYLNCVKGTTLTGRGVVSITGCKVELREAGPDPKRPERVVSVSANTCTKVGSATMVSGGVIETLNDSNMSNNIAKCP